jgi:hypothetical protein
MNHSGNDQFSGNFNRRRLILGLGMAAAALTTTASFPVSARLDMHSKGATRNPWNELRRDPWIDSRSDGDFLIVESSVGLGGHRHNLEIPMSVFLRPEMDDAQYDTTKAAFHRHTVQLTYSDLIEIQRGGHVTVKDSQWGEHSFEIYLP